MRSNDLDGLEGVCAALAHGARRRVLDLLRARGSLSAGELAERFDCAWPTLSRHLAVLADAGLVGVERVGRRRRYRLVRARLAALESWLDGLRGRARR